FHAKNHNCNFDLSARTKCDFLSEFLNLIFSLNNADLFFECPARSLSTLCYLGEYPLIKFFSLYNFHLSFIDAVQMIDLTELIGRKSLFVCCKLFERLICDHGYIFSTPFVIALNDCGKQMKDARFSFRL